jgi:predicted TIM-barrel fold metal-dependent hydrolase
MPKSHLKIDIYNHIFPPKYVEELSKMGLMQTPAAGAGGAPATLYDLDLRFRIMDRHEGLMHVLTLCTLFSDRIIAAGKSVEAARIANDTMAELVSKYPDRFPAAVACLPLDNIEAALQEADRAINELRMRGVQITTPINDRPIDAPEYWPLYEKMEKYNLPIWIHPVREHDYPDYKTEDRSLYRIASMLGWPYETSVAMIRLAMSGVLEKYPNIKFITHHCGAMIPYFADRIIQFLDSDEARGSATYRRGLTKAPIEYLRMFYNDTALYGNTPGLMCAYACFGADRLLFGTDLPFDNQLGARLTRQTINAINEMDISDDERKLIFEDNARKLLRLPI